jgi:uncharacterized membrane protein YqgA involved in biofilm formation
MPPLSCASILAGPPAYHILHVWLAFDKINPYSVAMVGTWINTAAIVAGSLAGLAIHRSTPERFIPIETIASGVALLLALVLGGLLGERLDLDAFFNGLGNRLERRWLQGEGGPWPRASLRLACSSA